MFIIFIYFLINELFSYNFMCEIYDGPCGKIFWDTLLVLAGSLSCSGIRGDLQILVVLVIYRLVGLTALVGKMSGSF